MTLDVHFDHPDFLAVHKPPTIGMHQEGQNIGLVTMLSQQLGGRPLWPVHRLDKVTSGLVLIAKNADTAAALSGLFAKRQVEKYYIALSDKKPAKKQGAVIGDMQKARRGQWKLSTSKLSPAVSQFFSAGLGNGLRLFVVRPHTGKTHQIRVMMKSLGAPILGDSHYGATPADRTYLHALALRFTYQNNAFSFICQPAAEQHFNSPEYNREVEKFTPPWALRWPQLANIGGMHG
ncbi:TIGR01621 family pseudouridine synthase [Bowmanella denitrificans]|uniref:TIGR01621 family pseudouridine synthase n=1 Tax=Bowmanella denitrificans TaxID=366582 RepID=A0ABP3HC97_9ALTE